jgi:serine/threonine protein kinase
MRAPALRKHAVSLPYRAPEHLTDPRSITDAADVYSAGVILWELLAGRPLFGQKSHVTFGRSKNLPEKELLEMEQRCLKMKAPSLSEISRPGGAIHPQVIKLVGKALERDPAARFSSLGELSHAIRSLPRGLIANSTEIASAVERLAGKAIARRQQALTEGAPMPVFGSKPPSNRVTARPDEDARVTIEIPRHPNLRGLADFAQADDAPAPPTAASSVAPDSSKMTRPMRPDFAREESKTTSPTRAKLMANLAREGEKDQAQKKDGPPAPAAGPPPAPSQIEKRSESSEAASSGEEALPVPVALPGRDESLSVSHVPAVDISSTKKKKSSSGWLLAVIALIAAGVGVGFLVMRGQANGEDRPETAVDANQDEPVDEPTPEIEPATDAPQDAEVEDAEADSNSAKAVPRDRPSTEAKTEDADDSGEQPPIDEELEEDAEVAPGDAASPAPRPTGSKKPSGKDKNGSSSGAFRPSGI